jgi:AcrR family transcriptional regulator
MCNPMSRPKKTEAEMQIRRDQILDTAYAILQKDGPHALTSRAIADRMGVAHMSLYTYFKNQAAILSALSEREMAKLHARQHAIEQRAETEDIVLVMLDALKLFITFACENPNLYRLAWVIPEGGGESLEQSRQRMQDTVWYLARLLKQGMEQGSFTTREPFLAAATVLGMVNMPHILFHSGKLIDPELRDRMVVEVLSAAMGYLKD